MTERPLLILMLIHTFHPLIGGAERQCLKQARGLLALGHQVTVVTGRHEPSWPLFEEIDGLPVARLPYGSPVEECVGPWYEHLLREGGAYDLFHIHMLNGIHAVAGSRAARHLGKPCIIKFSNSGTRFDLAKAARKPMPLSRWLLEAAHSADRIVAISGAMAEELEKAGIPPGKVARIPNGVELRGSAGHEGPAQAWALPGIPGLPGNDCMVLRVGSFSPKKDLPTLLRAWQLLLAHHPRALLVSVGGSEPPPEVKDLAAPLGDRVLFVPWQPRGIDEYLAAADLFVVPSIEEGLSNALLEAQAAGLPSVVTAAGGNPDLVSDGLNGLVVNCGDPGALAGALGALIASPGLRREYGRAALETVKKFDISIVAGEYERLYRHLLEEKRTGHM